MKEYKKSRLLLLFYLSFTFISNIHKEAYAQGKFWEKTYVTSIVDIPTTSKIHLGDCGTNIVVSYSYKTASNGFDGVLVKYNQNGDQLWIATYNGAANLDDYFLDMVVDEYDNIFVVGYTKDAYGQTDMLYIKYDKNGVLQWAETDDNQDYFNPNGTARNELHAATLDDDNELYATGLSTCKTGFGTGIDAVTMKISSFDGSITWSNRYNNNGSNSDKGQDIVYSKVSNKIYTAINFVDKVVTIPGVFGQFAQQNILIEEYSLSGGTHTDRALIDNAHGLDDYSTRIVIDDLTGNIYGTGASKFYDTLNSSNPDKVSQQILTFKLNSTGMMVWQRHDESPSQGDDRLEYGNALVLDANENVYVTGFAVLCGDMFALKYNSNGNLQWIKSFDGVSSSTLASGNDIDIDAQNGVYIAGQSNGWLTQKLKQNDGSISWTDEYGPAHLSHAIAVNMIGDIYSSGVVKSGNNYQLTLCKFSQSCFDTYSKIFNMTTNTSNGIISGIHKGRNKMEAGSSAGGGILSSGVVFNHPGSNVELIAGKQIIFYPNFRAKGTVSNRFLAKVDMCLHTTCQNSGATEFEKPGKPAVTPNLDEVAEGLVKLYPNPAGDMVNIKVMQNSPSPSSLYIYDYTGRLVLTRDNINSGEQTQINIQSFANGMYMAVVQQGQEIIFREKFVITK